MTSKSCGECRFYQVTQAREFDQIGTCKLQKLMGVFGQQRQLAIHFPCLETTGYPRRVVVAQRDVHVVARQHPCTLMWPQAPLLN